jgi:DNA-binding MarR family transcriptional regulator
MGSPRAENARAAELLAKLVENAEKQPDPPEKPSLEIGRRLEPDPGAAPMLRIRRFLTDMAYFREDVHTASWKSYGVDGKCWETLTYIWRGEASTPAEISKQVSEYRSYTEADYKAAVDDLVARGWLEPQNKQYVITEDGKKVRQEAEDITDQLYAAPFKAFSEGEIDELTGLLKKLAEAVRVPENESGG